MTCNVSLPLLAHNCAEPESGVATDYSLQSVVNMHTTFVGKFAQKSSGFACECAEVHDVREAS